LRLLKLEGKVAETAAIAADVLDEGEMKRRALLQDVAFQDMEEQAQAALAAARRAASAAAARRRALLSERDAALAELQGEKAASMKFNPHETGEITAINYLRKNGSSLDYNRQQLVFNTLSEAISQQVSAHKVRSWIVANDLSDVLTRKEVDLLGGALLSYTQGMRWQQGADRPRGSRPSYR